MTIYKSVEIITIDENNIILNFKNKQIKIPKTKFDDDELNNIINKNYCPGCKTISSKEYFGNKRSWCQLSRKISNHI